MFVLCYVTVTGINNGHGHTRYVVLKAIYMSALRDDIDKPVTWPVFSSLPPALFCWFAFYSLFRYSIIFTLLEKSFQNFFTHMISFCRLEPIALYRFLFKDRNYFWSHRHQHRHYQIKYHADWALLFECYFFSKFFKMLLVVFLGLTSTTIRTLLISV